MAAQEDGPPPQPGTGPRLPRNFPSKAKQPSFHLGEEMEQDMLPTGS